jgi:hypothetical protein
MPDPGPLRLSELKRALRWLRAQYRRRADEAARGEERLIDRIRKARAGGLRQGHRKDSDT